MSESAVQQQVHGYQSGHGLLGGTVKLARDDQDLVDRLSDIAGPLRPGETFDPYITTYPLPSGQFYVIARTWQDLESSRAGCVRTRSLFIPMEMWERTNAVSAFAYALTRPLRPDPIPPIAVPIETDDFGPVLEQRLPELVEALFLESRQPIVVFDSPDAESVALRVLTALWPSRRRTFATCTWCLAPRKLKGRNFDLVFAPRDARNRFSDWDGRRIEVVNRSPEARHRWTTDLVQALFFDPHPKLSDWDELGILEGDQVGDEAALRLSLMWRELEAKARTTPNAVLGMLDILNSKSVRPTIARTRLEPLVMNAIRLASGEAAPDGIWRFYLNLLGKFSDKLPSSLLLRQLRHASAHLAADHPKSAVSVLSDLENRGRHLPAVLAAGIGDGLSHALFCSEAALRPIEIGRRPLLRLVAFSKRFSLSLAKGVREYPQCWSSVAIEALQAPDADLIRRARRNLLPNLDAAAHAPLLPPLLTGLKASELATVVRTIGKTTNFGVEDFDRPLIAAARDDDALRSLREAILEGQPGVDADRFLLSALHLDPQDITWLLTSVPHDRGRLILAKLVDRADDGSIQMFLRDQRCACEALDCLIAEPAESAHQIMRILMSGRLDTPAFINKALLVYPHLSHTEKSRAAVEMLRRSLGELPPNSPVDLSSILADAAEEVNTGDLIVLLTQPSASANRIAANISAVLSSKKSIQHKVLSRIDELTNRLISRGTHGFSENTYAQWASLIEESHSISPESHLRAAIEALSYALKQPHYPLSKLIVVSFPTVYRRIVSARRESDLDFAVSLFLSAFTLFGDWDRGKTARKELVETFLSSDWPPSNLLLAALNAGIDQKILRRLSRIYGGNRYIEMIWDDASQLQEQQRWSIRNAITKFTEHPNAEDWD
ncbi:hypothetical protein [Azospirillum sp. TSA6c]|uniref:GAP1-N1 domain-containing protein n=1 Tax=unclassified Azospirillum TaxID=2630922 RepID=UPI0011B6728C|nr:hypothetical protein [Azospirillum sp. TSA6c]